MEQAVKKQRRAKGSGSFVPGKGAKEGKIMYRVQLPNGKRKQFEGKTETEAYRKYKEWLREHPAEKEGKRETTWFADYVNEWMENVGKLGLKTQSYERNKRTIRTYVVPYLGKYRLINLDTKTIQTELVNRMTNEPNAKTGKPNSFSTIKKPYDIVNACLKYAVKVGDITSNPCENVVLPKERKTDAKQIRPLTDDEAKRFLSACEVGMSQYEWVYKLILYTGLRMGEACALCPADIHLSEKYIDVHGTIIEQNEKYVYQGKTKTNKNRRVYFNDATKSLLEERLIYCPKNCYLANLNKETVNLAYLGRESSRKGAIDTTRPPCFTMNDASALLKIIHFLPSDVVLNILHSPKSNTVVTKINCIQKSPMQNAPSFQRFVCIIMYSESRSCS